MDDWKANEATCSANIGDQAYGWVSDGQDRISGYVSYMSQSMIWIFRIMWDNGVKDKKDEMHTAINTLELRITTALCT